MKDDLLTGVYGDAPESFQNRVQTTLEALPARTVPMLRRRGVQVLLAACLAVALLTGTAFATNFFGLGDVLVDDQFAGEQPRDIVSLQGYPDSNEYKATAEWMTFLSGYDQDRAVLQKVGNDPTGFEDEYGLYNVYSQEMADALCDIAARYDLRLHRSISIYDSAEALYRQAGLKAFLPAATVLGGYLYDDGSFQFDGTSYAGDTLFQYQLGRAVKGVFSEVTLNVGSAAGYTEWDYVTGSGVTAHLSLGPDKSVLFADLPEAFIYVNILGGENGGGDFMPQSVTRQSLEAFADSLDLSALG